MAPFAETKEQLGGYYLIECENLDEALDWASQGFRHQKPAALKFDPSWYSNRQGPPLSAAWQERR